MVPGPLFIPLEENSCRELPMNSRIRCMAVLLIMLVAGFIASPNSAGPKMSVNGPRRPFPK